MATIAEIIIPKMFTAYAEDKGYINVQGCHLGHAYAYSGLHHYQYFCEECDQVFSSAWGRIQGSMNYSERGNYFHCPHCGKVHRENVIYLKHKEIAPNKVRLVVKSYDSVVNFEVYSNTVEFQDYLKVMGGTYKEIFRFDIAKQTVLFSAYESGVKKETIEIGNPYKLDLLNDRSILRFFRLNSLANTNKKSELNKILKTLRETIHQKLEKRLGHKPSSLYVSQGPFYGTFLLPIFNIAYRVACPDAPNLPAEYRYHPDEIKKFWKAKLIEQQDFDRMENIIAITRRKKDFATGMIHAYSLANKPLVRRVVLENPFGVNMLIKAFSLCQNYDNAISMYSALNKLAETPNAYKELFPFLRDMKPIYGESGIIRLVEEAKEWQIWDCIRLYQQLNAEIRKALETEKVRLRDLHDWLSLRHKKQTHKNVQFDVPDHIVKRLSMQKDRLSFFLPEESMQLLEAGHELHNCVASYGHAMKENEKWIVLVADDKGKLAACLEIRGKELVQAKLDRNKPVSNNTELNNAITVWANKANLKINTSDVKVPPKKKTRVMVSA